MVDIKITIPYAPRTKKNSQRIVTNRKTGGYYLIPSKAYADYCEACAYLLAGHKGRKINQPVNIKCLFYMDTKRRVDLTNLLEAIDDILVKYGVISDDNYNIVVGHDFSRVLYDKQNPRTEIYISEVASND